MKIITIDPGKRSIGICVYQEGRYETYELKNTDTQEEILKYLPARLDRLVNWHGANVLIEGYPYGLRSAYIFDRAEIVGVIKHYLVLWGTDYKMVNPAKWKSEFFGKGWKKLKKRTLAEKAHYIEKVRELTGVTAVGTDAADALGIAKWFIDRRVFEWDKTSM